MSNVNEGPDHGDALKDETIIVGQSTSPASG
jgi:hypothetical protein